MHVRAIVVLSGLVALAAGLACVLPLTAADPPAAPAQPAGPQMEFVQAFRSGAEGPGMMTEASRVQFGGDTARH